MTDTHEQKKRQLRKERRDRIRGMVALGRIASRVPLDQVLDTLSKHFEEETSRERADRGLKSCSGRWALFQFTQPREN